MPQAANQPQDQQRNVRDLPVQVRAATLEPSTYNEADNTVEIVWTQGASVRRYDWWEGKPYDESLDVTTEAVDMTRFEAGTVQVLDGHRVGAGVNAILGIAVRGWIADGSSRRLRSSAGPADWYWSICPKNHAEKTSQIARNALNNTQPAQAGFFTHKSCSRTSPPTSSPARCQTL